eukprot:scaffold2501_cov423-Prasinococcus_capsulatus_cf.AAC.8
MVRLSMLTTTQQAEDGVSLNTLFPSFSFYVLQKKLVPLPGACRASGMAHSYAMGLVCVPPYPFVAHTSNLPVGSATLTPPKFVDRTSRSANCNGILDRSPSFEWGHRPACTTVCTRGCGLLRGHALCRIQRSIRPLCPDETRKEGWVHSEDLRVSFPYGRWCIYVPVHKPVRPVSGRDMLRSSHDRACNNRLWGAERERP